MAIGVLPDALTAWHRVHPDVAVNVVSYPHHDALETAVASGVGDLAIGPPPRRWSGETWRAWPSASGWPSTATTASPNGCTPRVPEPASRPS
jgi:DNA-binding transcriptional LysR family regulator